MEKSEFSGEREGHVLPTSINISSLSPQNPGYALDYFSRSLLQCAAKVFLGNF